MMVKKASQYRVLSEKAETALVIIRPAEVELAL
jgi:hypothetical protein